MKFARIVLVLVVLLVGAGVVVYAVGARLPVDHVTSVTSVIEAPPAKVFGLITDVANAPRWRHAVKSVNVLPPDAGRDHWVEDLGRGVKMDFLATRTEPLSANGMAKRVVLLSDPSYGGTWTYEISPGPLAGQTNLRITEAGYIHPPVYRFVMQYIFGMTKNLNQYVADMKAAVK